MSVLMTDKQPRVFLVKVTGTFWVEKVSDFLTRAGIPFGMSGSRKDEVDFFVEPERHDEAKRVVQRESGKVVFSDPYDCV